MRDFRVTLLFVYLLTRLFVNHDINGQGGPQVCTLMWGSDRSPGCLALFRRLSDRWDGNPRACSSSSESMYAMPRICTGLSIHQSVSHSLTYSRHNNPPVELTIFKDRTWHTYSRISAQYDPCFPKALSHFPSLIHYMYDSTFFYPSFPRERFFSVFCRSRSNIKFVPHKFPDCLIIPISN